MKAPDIRYKCPQTIAEALALLADDEQYCQPLAGGQSLMPMMHLRLAQPELLIDLNCLPELDFIEQRNGELHIGAMIRYSALLSSEVVGKCVPLFTLALPHIAHQAVRNRGTIGGSTALADPAAEMPALLKSLNANIVVVSQSGQREISANDFFLGIYETALAEDELVHSIKVPVASDHQRFGFYELARRHGDYAMAGVAICAQSINPYRGLRIVFFGIGDLPTLALDAQTVLEGADSTDEAIVQQAQQSLSALEYSGDANLSVEAKMQLARVVLQRALKTL